MTGNPVRSDFAGLAPKARGEAVHLLVFGGSQGSRALNDAIVAALPRLAGHIAAGRLSITHQTGPRDLDRVREAYAAAGVEGDVRPFIERMVDELLKKPQFGEHWARMWLDLARYADTKGYEKDRGRTMWPYRDWVVNALNDDMPLDRFTTEQLAGDLLPNPTRQQLIATAFHRNTMANDEGGTDELGGRLTQTNGVIDVKRSD